jgi:dTDP-4-dehydrorhamnose reductase
MGLIKQNIDDNSEKDVSEAYLVNSELPRELNEFATETSTPIIQIGTDCVYSGRSGNYSEDSEFDCNDVYGLSKVSGESESKSLMTIRCSIIGHENKTPVSLMDWFLSQNDDARVKGYTNHYWNGVTTLAFAQVVDGIIRHSTFSPGVVHLVPRDQISKFDLLNILAKQFGREDIDIRSFETELAINRTLATLFPDRNAQLWRHAGYNEVPSISELIKDYAEWSS